MIRLIVTKIQENVHIRPGVLGHAVILRVDGLSASTLQLWRNGGTSDGEFREGDAFVLAREISTDGFVRPPPAITKPISHL